MSTSIKQLQMLEEVFEEFANLENSLANSQGLPLQVARTFIAICLESDNKEIHTSEVNKHLHFTSATLSRTINTLSGRRKRNGVGLGLIDTHESLVDRRAKIITLTLKGQALLKKLQKKLRG